MEDRGIQPKSSLEANNWQYLQPSSENDTAAEVGVVEVHPSLNRVAYATRIRTDQSHDLGKTQIVVHDFHDPSSERKNLDPTGRVVCSFSLRELTNSINEYRYKSQLSLVVAASAHSREIRHSLSTISSSTMPITVQLLGAVQNLAFLDREALCNTVAPGFVKMEEPKGLQRLMIGFRRCIVVVSLFKLKRQTEQYARGVSVLAYIGPDDLDEQGRNSSKKKQPASFAAPISEHILAYGCYDGGIRFYDMLGKKQAKSALGPNGKSNPVVRVINANRVRPTKAPPRKVRPRIICACASGVAFIWEIDLLIDPTTGNILHFIIPPPLARIDGLVAAVSGQGIAAKCPPQLSPSSVASLSPCSSWDQLDVVNSQFEISYDPHRNLLFWVFSPECMNGASNQNNGQRESAEADGVLVSWNLSKLPSPGWPPPLATPFGVTKLPHTAHGRVTAHSVLPGFLNDTLPSTNLASIYTTSSGEMIVAGSDLKTRGDSVQMTSASRIVTNLTSLFSTPVDPNKNHICHAISASRFHPSVVAIGTRSGTLITKITASGDINQLFTIREEAQWQNEKAPECDSSLSYSMDKEETSSQQQQLLLRDMASTSEDESDLVVDLNQLGQVKKKIFKLESQNSDLRRQLEKSKSDAAASDKQKEQMELKFNRLTNLLEQQQKFCHFSKAELDSALAKVQSLENELKEKSESCETLESEVEELKSDLGSVTSTLEQATTSDEKTVFLLSTALAKVEALEKENYAGIDMIEKIKAENEQLKLQLKESSLVEKKDAEIDVVSLQSEATTSQLKEPELEAEATVKLKEAEETEKSLRNYIKLLEEDKVLMDQELEEARQKADKYEKSTKEKNAELKEQKMALESLVNLLDYQKRDHSATLLEKDNELTSLKEQTADLKMKLQSEIALAAEAMKANRIENESARDKISRLEFDNTKLKEEASQTNGLFIAMKVELQNALNELAEYQRDPKGN